MHSWHTLLPLFLMAVISDMAEDQSFGLVQKNKHNTVTFTIIYLIENTELGIKQVLSLVTILRLVVYFCASYLYMLYSHIYVLRHVLAVALASVP